MSASKLVKPSVEYKESFLEALPAYQKEGVCTSLNLHDLRENFESYVQEWREERGGHHRNYPDWVEIVPETILWLVKDGEYLGTMNIRHRLNWHLEKWGGNMSFIIRPEKRNLGFGRKIISKAIPYANALGLDKILITVDPEDKALKRVLEHVGAKFEDETQGTERFPRRQRYWLDCS